MMTQHLMQVTLTLKFFLQVVSKWTKGKPRWGRFDLSPVMPVMPTEIQHDVTRFSNIFLHRFAVQAPDTRLIQYDCGKLQILATLLRTLQAGGHRVLIFTQMTKMLDVLESFLNYHGYVYMRLDGSTRVEMRQCLMER